MLLILYLPPSPCGRGAHPSTRSSSKDIWTCQESYDTGKVLSSMMSLPQPNEQQQKLRRSLKRDWCLYLLSCGIHHWDSLRMIKQSPTSITVLAMNSWWKAFRFLLLTPLARQAYHACQESGALPASQKVVQHRWAEVTLFQLLGDAVIFWENQRFPDQTLLDLLWNNNGEVIILPETNVAPILAHIFKSHNTKRTAGCR